jgi:S1-C subfamily serine protease
MKYLLVYCLGILMLGCLSVQTAKNNFKHVERVESEVGFKELVARIGVLQNGIPVAGGSGVVIKSSPLVSSGEKGGATTYLVSVLTAKHVVEKTLVSSDVEVIVYLQASRYGYSRIIMYNDQDAAIIQFKTTDVVQEAEIDYRRPVPLEEVCTAGYPLGMTLTITSGIMNYGTRVNTGRGFANLWLCTAPSYPGNSGGGIFNKNSRKLIGVAVMSGVDTRQSNKVIIPYLNLFVPVYLLEDWIEGVISNG